MERCVTPAELARVAELLPDPAAEVGYRNQLAREAYLRGLLDGDQAGYERCARDYESLWRRAGRPAHGGNIAGTVAERRWHVCCGPCRRRGHQAGCARCRDGGSSDFGLPHDDDWRGGVA